MYIYTIYTMKNQLISSRYIHYIGIFTYCGCLGTEGGMNTTTGASRGYCGVKRN
jgi:hypothetical protein